MGQLGKSLEQPLVIAGGGIAGLSLALAVKRALGPEFPVILADPALASQSRGDDRAYAVAAAACDMLEMLGVWPELAGAATAMTEMVITDSRNSDAVRPVFLTFDGEVREGQPFAYMIESTALLSALLRACRDAKVELRPVSVRTFEARDDGTAITFSDGEGCLASLLVAADGARSRLRERAGIGWVSWSYRQSGLVATLSHERPHHGRAVEHFLPSGPFAILPLSDGGQFGHRSSIVWSERDENVPALLGLDQTAMLDEIRRRFGLQLGELALESKVSAMPLGFGIARRFVGERLALLGDAAHLIHPIAGQGLNLGLRDVAALAEVIVDAARLGLDPGAMDVLETYQRSRHFDTLTMGVMTDGLNRLFSNDFTPFRLARDFGLGLVERMPALKRLLIREAAGLAGEPPRLLRGEAL